jgi:hypothetical protein
MSCTSFRFIPRCGVIALALGVLLGTSAWAGDPIIGPQVRIDVAGGTFASNETTMAASEASPLEIVGAWNDWRRSGGSEIINMGVAVTSDGGQTWLDLLVRPPAGNQSNVEGDPMTAYDNRTGALWVGAISFSGNGGVYVARKNPGVNTFAPSVMSFAGSSDKCWMAAGPQRNLPNTTRLYVVFNRGIQWSDDMGATFNAPRSLGSGIGFLPRVGPNGEVYVMYWDFGNGVLLSRSLDNGATFQTIRVATRLDVWGTQDGSRFPGNFRVPALNYLAVDSNTGTLYAVWFDTTNRDGSNYNTDLYFSKSTNQGTTWTAPRIINGDTSPPGDCFWPWLEVDQQGRIHMFFYDTRGIVQADGTINGLINAYYSYSDDEGATWNEFQLTPGPFNCNNDGLNRGQQFLGDYCGLAVTGNTVYPCYLDTRNGDPDIYTHAITRQVAGRPLRFVVTRGALAAGGIRELGDSDDEYVIVEQRRPTEVAAASAEIEVTTVASEDSFSSFTFTYEGNSDGTPARQRIELRNFATGQWDQIDERDASNADGVVQVTINTDVDDYVDPGTNEMKARIGYHDRGVTFLSWSGNYDQVGWTFNP